MVDFLTNKIRSLAILQPNKLSVAFKSESLTYAQLYEKMCGIAKILREEGVKSGDRVCFSAVSKPEMIAIYLGVQICGAVAVFLDKNGTQDNLVTIYNEVKAKLFLTDKPMKECACKCNIRSLKDTYINAKGNVNYEEVYVPLSEDMLAELLFTTGTTGKPKGVMLTYKAVYNILINTIEGVHIQEDTILLLPLPLNHSFALRVLRAMLYSGATIVLQNGFTFAKEVENNIIAFRCNAMACVPASYEVMKVQMQDAFSAILSRLQFIEFSAGFLSIRQRKEITELLPDVQIYNTWGSSESGGAIFCDVSKVVSNPFKIASLGRPLAGRVEVKILDSSGNVMVENDKCHPGRMALRGDMQMAGYWNDENNTQKVLVDGWLLTGDMAYVDEDGDVYMLGRMDDIINVGGEKVSPIEIENVSGQYKYIKECACIGVDDPENIRGQIPILFMVVRNGYEEGAFVKYLSSNLERYKIPQKYVKLQQIPHNHMQKVDRKELHRIWDNQDELALENPVVNAILSRRSIRKFTNQEIPMDILKMLLKCGYYAPSGHNLQSWRFTVLTNVEDILNLKEKTKIVAEQEKVHFYGWENPKVLILISNDMRNQDGCQDASCAAENIMLAAQSYGIGSVWLNPLMSLRNIEPVKSVLDSYGIPTGHTVWASIALGYPVNDGAVLQKKTDVIKWI